MLYFIIISYLWYLCAKARELVCLKMLNGTPNNSGDWLQIDKVKICQPWCMFLKFADCLGVDWCIAERMDVYCSTGKDYLRISQLYLFLWVIPTTTFLNCQWTFPVYNCVLYWMCCLPSVMVLTCHLNWLTDWAMHTTSCWRWNDF